MPSARPPLRLWMAVATAAAAGALMALAFPAAAIWPLVFVALAMLLPALMGRSIGGALLVGLSYGLVFFALQVSFTARYLGPVPWIALTVVEGALTAVALVPVALAYRWLPRAWPRSRAVALPLLIAGLWTVHELFLGNWPYGGFPWARLGMSQAQGPFAPVTSWLGVSGLSFLMVALVALVIEIVRMGAWRRPTLLVVPLATLLVLVLTPLFPTARSGEMRIAAVQGNGSTGYFDEREPYGVIAAQAEATRTVAGEPIDLLVWPEGGVDYDPFRDEATARKLTRLVNRFEAPLLANTATERGDRIFNTSFLWTQEGEATQLHDKRHPVPFGEYVPDRDFYYAIAPELIGLIGREYTPGSNPPLVRVDGTGVGLAICFDVIYDEVIREGVAQGAEVLVFQTNNADFRGTDENLQQLAFARMRAIETGRSVVNVSTVGTSQIIRPDGTTVSGLDADEAGVLLEEVELRSGLTAGVVLGPWIQLGMLIISPAALVVAGLLSRRRG
ncbi:apolipoprotein N-acyltransferase [Microbacterium esteraromaticum]|uniref:Apolipoprotein N-acyltransferase n=2 Tax=Microbacterium esteraromaticum TaxID=57043 RepID=A0A7D7WJK1_9MICO|nr:apolipoprotein N-acyltransferase [Microbacterium esteraromaticum]QMU98773.1 apolipoprotein N-acyltransferase [Microbacterium esteraromaticum]